MKDIDESSPLTIELAKLLIQEMQTMSLPWIKAFLRLDVSDDHQGVKGSYVLENVVKLFDVFKHKRMFAAALDIAPHLRETTSNEGRRFSLALLIVDSKFNYGIKYEYADSQRWATSKLNGNNGIPSGYVD